jgi:hypothetical protein
MFPPQIFPTLQAPHHASLTSSTQEEPFALPTKRCSQHTAETVQEVQTFGLLAKEVR